MPASTVKDICDEVKTLIEGFYPATFESIDVVNVPRLDEESLGSERCYIVGQGRTSSNSSRGIRQYTYTILVFVVGRVDSANSDSAYDIHELALGVSEKLERATLPISKVQETETTVVFYDVGQIKEQNVSQSLITVTFDGMVRSV